MENISYNPSDYEILAFYPYPSTAIKIVEECDELPFNNYHGNQKIKDLFEGLMNEIDSHTTQSLRDNKISIKIKNKETKDILYISYKDGFYRIGTDVFQEHNLEYTFEKNKDFWLLRISRMKNKK